LGSQGLGLGWKWRMGRRGSREWRNRGHGGNGGGEWKAKLFIQPAAAEGGRRCSEGERRLAKQGRGREACTLVAGGWKSIAQRRGATGADGLQTVRLSRNSPRVRQRAGQLRAWHSANAA
jgi:hypothetical protein